MGFRRDRRVMVVFGTRPEAIKMAPVVAALKATPGVETLVTVTAQHREMLDQALDLFQVTPDDDLDLMATNQSLPNLFARILTDLSGVLEQRRPDLVLVHGDTATALAAALAAFYAKIPVGHVEAGLRTGNIQAPWPEEANRRLTAPIASLHFAPTPRSRLNLLAEGIPESAIHVTGNTVIDALLSVAAKIKADTELNSALTAQFSYLDPHKRLVLVTGHRRENIGTGFEQVCLAMKDLAQRPDVQLLYPVHPNPLVREPVTAALQGTKNAILIPPLDYLPFVYLMSRAHLILTDSGGIQEEAPSLGTPVLVLRETTERPEAVQAGTVKLVGTDRERIVAETVHLLEDAEAHLSMARAHNPYGDGRAAQTIADIIAAGRLRG